MPNNDGSNEEVTEVHNHDEVGDKTPTQPPVEDGFLLPEDEVPAPPEPLADGEIDIDAADEDDPSDRS